MLNFKLNILLLLLKTLYSNIKISYFIIHLLNKIRKLNSHCYNYKY